MDENAKKMLGLMFKEDELICCSPDKFGYHSIPFKNMHLDKIMLVSPNSNINHKIINTSDLIFVALNPMKKGFRNDLNCSSFRNFLIEMDNFDKIAQIEYIKNLKTPYSAMVWSGSKSVHTLISLSEDLPDEKTYRTLYKWLLGIVTLSDQALGNPSRSIRIPGAIRPETGKEQKLIELKGKVKLEDFIAWLKSYDHLRPKEREKRKPLTNEADPDNLSPWLRKALKENDIDFSKGRNKVWYSIFFDFAVAGYTQEQAEAFLENFYTEEHDFKRREWLGTAKSAYEHAIK